MNRFVDHLIIHCAATKATQNFSAEDIDSWHRRRGWLGNGYHYVIKRDGTLQSDALGDRCRPVERAGAHVGDCGSGWNSRTIAVCLIGGVDNNNQPENNFTEAQFKTLEETVLTILEDHPSITTIGGHRDLIKVTGASPKACPSFEVADWWKDEVLPKHQDTMRYNNVKLIGK